MENKNCLKPPTKPTSHFGWGMMGTWWGHHEKNHGELSSHVADTGLGCQQARTVKAKHYRNNWKLGQNWSMKKTNAFLAHVPVMNPQKDQNYFSDGNSMMLTHAYHIFSDVHLFYLWQVSQSNAFGFEFMRVEMCFAVAGWMSWNHIGPMATPKQPK